MQASTPLHIADGRDRLSGATWAVFVADNEDAFDGGDMDLFKIRNDLRRKGFHLGGGGASARWALMLDRPEIGALLSAVEGIERERGAHEEDRPETPEEAAALFRADWLHDLRMALPAGQR